jgi:predicted 2-oxoglutarate/Fe(II)-dependent dioxygenase YbiX
MDPLENKYKMNLQDYIAIYNINNPSLCRQVIQMMDEKQWIKHSYCNPITGEHTTCPDDLDMSYQNDAVTNDLQKFFEQCTWDYLSTVAPVNFPLQELTRIRFNRYNVGTNMKMHHDHIHTIFDGERKGVPILSFLALLNDDFEGGDFLMFDGEKIKLSMGDVLVFPSNFLYPHAVTTVTKGTRYSCVSWGY